MTLDELWPNERILQALADNDSEVQIIYQMRDEYEAARNAATWQPAPEVWAELPYWYEWISVNEDRSLRAWVEEPVANDKGWQGGNVKHLNSQMPPLFDWRQAKYRRPEAQP